MIEIDGSHGEGGGQILRSALALSLVTQKPFAITQIRARRKKPGLLRQHLTAVQAAAEIGGARTRGAEMGSPALVFEPDRVRAGDYAFAIGTAGSTMLVLQTVLPALLLSGASTIRLEGGTHNPWAPPYDFIEHAFLPLQRRMGADIEARLLRHGFHPAGGGAVEVRCATPSTLRPLSLPERGAPVRRHAVATICRLARSIAERELSVLVKRLGLDASECEVRTVDDADGSGNILALTIESTHVTEIFTAVGQRSRRAEAVAGDVVNEARAYLAAGAPVGPYLADQLLLPLALAGGGSFRTQPLTRHAETNAEVIARFLDVEVEVTADGATRTVTVRR